MPELYPPLPLVGGPQNRLAIRIVADMNLQDSKKLKRRSPPQPSTMNTGKEDAHPLSAIEFAAKFRGLLGGSENSGCKSHFGERLTTAFPANSVQVPWSIANRVDAGRRIKNFFAGKISLQDSLRRNSQSSAPLG